KRIERNETASSPFESRVVRSRSPERTILAEGRARTRRTEPLASETPLNSATRKIGRRDLTAPPRVRRYDCYWPSGVPACLPTLTQLRLRMIPRRPCAVFCTVPPHLAVMPWCSRTARARTARRRCLWHWPACSLTPDLPCSAATSSTGRSARTAL